MTSTSSRYKNHELLFHQKIQSQLDQVRTLLNTCSTSTAYAPSNHQRSPVYFADYPKHSYNAKFGLAEFLTNVAIASQMNILDVLGVDEDKFRLMHRIVNGLASGGESVGSMLPDPYAGCNHLILRFSAEEICVKSSQEEVLEDDSIRATNPRRRKSVDQPSTPGLFSKKKVKQDVAKEEDINWKVTVNYSIKVIATYWYGPDSSGVLQNGALQRDPPPLLLKSKSAETTLVTPADAPRPLQAKVVRDPIDFDLTWLFKNISSEDFSCNFVIDQKDKHCNSPRRNKGIDAAVKYFSELEGWCSDICTYFSKGTCWNVDLASRPRPQLEDIDAESVFVPVVPLFEPPSSALMRKTQGSKSGEIKKYSPLLPIDDIRMFLNEQCRTLDEKIQELVSRFPPPDSTSNLITSAEATLFLLFSHSALITEYFIDGLQAIEQTMVDTLTKACGKELTLEDFDNFVRFSNIKLFSDRMYEPKAFHFDIRRPNRVPEGVLCIEMSKKADSAITDSQNTWPVLTVASQVGDALVEESSGVQIKILSTASMTQLSGKCYVHGWLTHQFEGRHDFQYQLRTTSRQFSNILLLTGTISHNQCMDVKNAMLIQNKDEVLIPLTLNRARAIGDFNGLVSSLSPNQQSFAHIAQESKLESSVFGVCVIEITPQLEMLLGLPLNSLAKEVNLVQTLISLFVEHQISADLVSYDGPEDAPVREMIAALKENVEAALNLVHAIPAVEHVEASCADEVAEELPKLIRSSGLSRSTFSVASDARHDKERISTSTSDDNASLVSDRMNDLFRKKKSHDSQKDLHPELPIEGGQYVINSAPKSLKRVPSLDYLEAMCRKEADADITTIPRKLNARLKALQSKQLQQTVIETGEVWVKRSTLAPESAAQELGNADRAVNTKQAMDLLDALSRSGSLPIPFAELHAIVGVTHCFSQNLVDTLIIDNVDPIKQLSDSMVLLASVIHDIPADDIVSKEM